MISRNDNAVNVDGAWTARGTNFGSVIYSLCVFRQVSELSYASASSFEKWFC